MDLAIAGKWALVCGASKGLGLGCAQALVQEGVNVVINARGDTALQAAAAQLRAANPGVKVLAVRLEGFDAKALRDAMDRLKQQLGDAVILLAGVADGKAALVAGVAGAALGKAKAGALISHVAGQINGKGGGRPDMAQGGGDDGAALISALSAVPGWVESQLG